MRVLSFSLLVVLLFTGFVPQVFAEPKNYYGRKKYSPFLTGGRTSLNVDVGMRRNNFDWNIASDATGAATPNVLSELTWENVMLMEMVGEVRHEEPIDIPFARGGLVFEGKLSGGLTFAGSNQDSDYNGDNRTLEFSRSTNGAEDGYAYGVSGDLGYKVILLGSPRSRSRGALFSLMPLVGYGWDRQMYKIINGYQTIPNTGAFGGLDSEYETTWSGPFVGLEAELENKRHLFKIRGEYHDLDYEAEAVWNLRSNFAKNPSFVHEADGDGIVLDAEYGYALDSRYELTVNAMYQSRTAENGTDLLFFSDGTSSLQRLNEVNDESQALRFGLRYYY